MTKIEKCVRLLVVLDPGFRVSIEFTIDKKFQIDGIDASGEVIYEVEDGENFDQAIDNLWAHLVEQVERRDVRGMLALIDETAQ